MKVTLGQLFLLRRDLKQEINNLSSEITPLIAYREDKESTKEEYYAVMLELTTKRNKLHLYDTLIEEKNAYCPCSFKGTDYSLNDARHYKVHLTGEIGFYEALVRHAANFNKRVERESIYKTIDLPTGGQQQVIDQVERKYILSVELKELKKKVKELKEDVQLLDSLIQMIDWSTEVEIPE